MANGPMIHPPQNPNIRPPKPPAIDLPPESKTKPPTEIEKGAAEVRSEYLQHADDLKIDHDEYQQLSGSIDSKFSKQLDGSAEVHNPDGLAIRNLGWDLDVQLNEAEEGGEPIVEFESPNDRKDLQSLVSKMRDLPPSPSEGRDYLEGNTLNRIVTSDLNAVVKLKDLPPEAREAMKNAEWGHVPADYTITYVNITDMNMYAAIGNSASMRESTIMLLPRTGGEFIAGADTFGPNRWNAPLTTGF